MTNQLQTRPINRFIVHHPRFPSYLINGYAIGLDELRLKFYVTRDIDMVEFFKREMLESIELGWLDEQGNIIDKIKFNKCRVKEVNSLGDWSLDTPVEVVIVYDIGTMGKPE